MLSIIVPCFNEEKLVEKSISEIVKAISLIKLKKNYEIIIIDDCSTDSTWQIISNLKKKNKNIKLIKNFKNFGLGYNFKKGYELSKNNNIILIPSDNSHKAREICKIISHIGKNFDVVTTYYSNTSQRSFLRNLFTKSYTPFLNFIFGTSFKYFNGITLYNKKKLKNLKLNNNSFSYQIEILVFLFYKKKFKYKIIPTILNDRKRGSKAFKFKNSILVFYSIFKIFLKSILYRFSRN